MCFLVNKITPEFSASEEIDQIFSAKDTDFCPFCKKKIAGQRIALVVHFAMVHTERSLLECSKFLESACSTFMPPTFMPVFQNLVIQKPA